MKQIEGFKEREKGTNFGNAEKTKVVRTATEGLVNSAEQAMEVLLNWVNKDRKKLDNRVLGHTLRSSAITRRRRRTFYARLGNIPG